MAVLEEYHAALGELIYRYQGTPERFTGDGLMVFFNDPILLDEPAGRAVEMALAMRDRVATLIDGWSRLGHDLGFGVGIAQGFATLGRIGYEGRFDYAAIGTVTNLAARLWRRPGTVLVAQRVFHAVENHAVGESIGVLGAKRIQQVGSRVQRVSPDRQLSGGAVVTQLDTDLETLAPRSPT